MSQQKGTLRWFARAKLIFCACVRAFVCVRACVFGENGFSKTVMIIFSVLLENQHFSFFIGSTVIWWPFLFALRFNVAIC